MILGGVQVDKIVCDSRLADSRTAFVCITGAVTDGHFYALSAYKAGCRLFICEYHVDLPSDAVCLIVPDTRIALAELSAEIYGHPADRLKIIGVTGTKGKTTVSFLLYKALNEAGRKTALVGTNGIYINDRHTSTVNSTPESCELHRIFTEAADNGAEFLVMEVSSQAYKLSRVYGIKFEIGIFTNLSCDHIGPTEHSDYDDYRSCKAKLFSHSKHSIINADDDECMYMSYNAAGTIAYYSTGHINGSYAAENESDGFYTASEIRREYDPGFLGVSFIYDKNRYKLKIPGIFNVSNAMAVIAACDRIGIDTRHVLRSLAETDIKGRFEQVETIKDRMFIIDYAHNGASLKGTLETLREYHPERLVCLFGSVGGRTKLRRAELGKAAAHAADFLIITSDNPDNENPLDIIEDIQRNVGVCPHVCIPDRHKAIQFAVMNSLPGDIVLFAGKGHEEYQLINGVRVPFSEIDIIKSVVSQNISAITGSII